MKLLLPDQPIEASVEDDARLPLHPYPAGWYALAFTEELERGAVTSLRWAGREIVAFRTWAGIAAALDAACPHLGAHLGHGGRVEGERLRCPMHGLCFGADGACTGSQGPTRAPKLRAGALEVRERAGLILAWHHPEGAPPSWEPPLLADPALGAPHHRRVELLTHVQELAENLFDIGHFAGVHGFLDPEIVEAPAADGPVIRVAHRMARSADFLGRFSRRIGVDMRLELHGLGVFLVDSVADGGLSARMAITATPIAPGRSALRLSVWARQGDATIESLIRWLPASARAWLNGRLLLIAMMRDIRQDQDLLRYKRHLPRPGLASADAGIVPLRRWARQFYPAIEA